jgi:hypothetical protein
MKTLLFDLVVAAFAVVFMAVVSYVAAECLAQVAPLLGGVLSGADT